MERKSFLQLGSLGLLPLALKASSRSKKTKLKIPSHLIKGDTIGIVCPAGFATNEDVAPAVFQLQQWGFTVILGETVGKRNNTFGGTDIERAKDFQAMLDNNAVKAIMCATGGYGSVRIIDLLDFSNFSKNPKWIIGFSDITVFHAHLNRVCRTASIHSKMCGSFPIDRSDADPIQIAAIDTIRKALIGEPLHYSIASSTLNRVGKATGELIGGNLKILENMSGSVSSPDTTNKILFVEDVSEPLYNIDRMFCNLLRAGKLDKLKGLIVGGFTSIKPDTPDSPFGKDVYTIVMEKVGAFNYPVCFDFPVGHQKNNVALKCGVQHQLVVTQEQSSLTEIQ
ncbi:MAG: LD-carboxypeptidase [Chitinophagaceae bacterium]|nr:LD-carboxypeptidase [Chitinophagaceae bacterium]MCA6448083.1 LD-carboxypeptidase [Chitinophagaceae bacterium]